MAVPRMSARAGNASSLGGGVPGGCRADVVTGIRVGNGPDNNRCISDHRMHSVGLRRHVRARLLVEYVH